MAPRSPTLAFMPTPALETNKENYSPFNDRHAAEEESTDHERRGNQVRFTHVPSRIGQPTPRAHSIATTTVPLLPSVPSASQLPRQSVRVSNAAPEVDIDAYFEHSRSLLEQLRANHEQEKKAFDDERKLWDTERTVLRSRIADLEFRLNKSKGQNGKRRFSNEASTTTATAAANRLDFGIFSGNSKPNMLRKSSLPQSKTSSTTPPIWEGTQPTAPVTRVFSNDSAPVSNSIPATQLPSISEDESANFPQLTQEISPTSVKPREQSARSGSISIDKIDSTLDGINLKSAALQSSFVPRIMTPSQMSSPSRSASPAAKHNPDGNLKVEMGNVLSPFDEKLKKHAGHTPMAYGAQSLGINESSTITSTEVPTPKDEGPVAPAPTTRPRLRPSENSDSYFSFSGDLPVRKRKPLKEGEKRTEEVIIETDDDDPELQGPLMLDTKNDSGSSHEFLDQVDAKLMEAAANRKDSALSDSNTLTDGEEVEKPKEKVSAPHTEKDLDGPTLRLKKSTNFGSAWGRA